MAETCQSIIDWLVGGAQPAALADRFIAETCGRIVACGIRAVTVGEAMMACVIADHVLRHRGQVGG